MSAPSAAPDDPSQTHPEKEPPRPRSSSRPTRFPQAPEGTPPDNSPLRRCKFILTRGATARERIF
ncbi:MAG: hypothetical protein KAI47_22905, partial [Deltaproteobacteria bacterium]|nr:hypothetical protein [Deltaproteobacteria bacterium]